MRRYDVTDEAVLEATPAEIFSALEDEAAGRSRWWWPWLTLHRLNEIPYTQVGSRVTLTVSGRGQVDNRWLSPTFVGVVREVEPERRLVVNYVDGAFRGTGEWTLEPVDDLRTHVTFHWVADPAGVMLLWDRLLDIPRHHSRVIRKGFAAMELHIAQHRPPAAA